MKVPFFYQETDYTCAVACLRMVLAFYGATLDETDLVGPCGTTADGTVAYGLVEGSQALGYEGIVCEGDMTFLCHTVANGNFPCALKKRSLSSE